MAITEAVTKLVPDPMRSPIKAESGGLSALCGVGLVGDHSRRLRPLLCIDGAYRPKARPMTRGAGGTVPDSGLRFPFAPF